jgi:HAD superfamily hydrolase (TIGR01549 family)
VTAPLAIEAVGFDFDHTLGFDNRLECDVLLELAGAGAAHLVDTALAAFRYGASSIDEAVAAIGVEPRVFRALVLERAGAYVRPQPDGAALLSCLRERGLPYAILSNGWTALQRRKAELVGFDGPVLVSEELGARKPARAAFLHLQRALSVPLACIAYVGDDPVSDMCGALSAGMHAVWLDAEGRSYPQDVAAPDARIATLAEFLPLVPGPPLRTAKRPA